MLVEKEGNREAIIKSPALPVLLEFCHGAEEILREQALRSLASLAEDGLPHTHWHFHITGSYAMMRF